MQVLNFCILYAKYYIYIQHLFNNNTLDLYLYTCLNQLKQALKIIRKKNSSSTTLSMRIYKAVVSVGKDSYQSRSKMNWRDPEFNKHEPKSWAQAEKCEYSIDKTITDI